MRWLPVICLVLLAGCGTAENPATTIRTVAEAPAPQPNDRLARQVKRDLIPYYHEAKGWTVTAVGQAVTVSTDTYPDADFEQVAAVVCTAILDRAEGGEARASDGTSHTC